MELENHLKEAHGGELESLRRNIVNLVNMKSRVDRNADGNNFNFAENAGAGGGGTGGASSSQNYNIGPSFPNQFQNNRPSTRPGCKSCTDQYNLGLEHGLTAGYNSKEDEAA